MRRAPDFVRQAHRVAAARANARPRSRTRSGARATRARVLFHGPSFSAGILLGATVVVLGAYAPELLNGRTPARTSDAAVPPASVQFEFHDILENSKVDADASVYKPPEPAAAAAQPGRIMIQAASFRDVDDAEALRARLLLQDLPVSMAKVEIASGTWYRVTVGPFANRTDANRVMTRLREQDLAAIFI